MLGAVGQLQFEIVAQRLATEYKVDALYEGVDVSTARWLVFPDEETKKEFCNEQRNRLAKDSEGNLCYMASSIYNLQTTMKHWPKVEFKTTREQGQRFEN
jgi:peptide chain release factor 3